MTSSIPTRRSSDLSMLRRSISMTSCLARISNAASIMTRGHPSTAARLWAERWIRPERGETRSEEHTSELQSLMRISYAVFCLKKKIPDSTQHINNIHMIDNLHNNNIQYIYK